MSEEVLAVRLLEVLSPTDPTLAAFGFAALLAGLARLAYTRRTARWPRTLGTVLSSEVLTRPGRFGLPAPSLDVSYEYRVGATTYRGTCRDFSGVQTGAEGAEVGDLAKRCKPGSTIGVYYHPRRPSESVLDVGADYLGFAGVGIGLSLLWIAFV